MLEPTDDTDDWLCITVYATPDERVPVNHRSPLGDRPLGTRLIPGIASSVAVSLKFGSAKWDIDCT